MRRVAALLTLALLAGACSEEDPFDALPTPDRGDEESTTTTAPEPDLTGAPLAAVRGTTTTTVALGPGPLTIVGRVEGPEGPVAGATVQLERLVGDGSAMVQVPTAADGTWNVADVLGGRYRVRAWRRPDLAVARTQVVFLETGPQRAVELRLEPVGGVRVDAVIAPDPPQVDEQANLKVRVAERSVDEAGVVRDVPRSGVMVQLAGTGDWAVSSSTSLVTGADGSVTFRVTCEDDGEQPLTAVLEGDQSFPLTLPACVDPDATTTTTAPDDTTTTTDP
ncbi:MAG TPA: hypothetical protein VEA78_04205 [Acidimicrobiales bacterium]|nr:hypothetical protein [Acidimicrobiales bacterium]